MSSPIEDFLRSPVLTVRLESSERVKELEAEVQRLQADNSRLLALYTSECDISMRALDLLRAHGIKWR